MASQAPPVAGHYRLHTSAGHLLPKPAPIPHTPPQQPAHAAAQVLHELQSKDAHPSFHPSSLCTPAQVHHEVPPRPAAGDGVVIGAPVRLFHLHRKGAGG